MRRLSPSIHALIAVLVVAGAGCADSPTAKRSGIAAQLDIISGDAQIGTVGLELASPLVVKVLDAEGRAVAGQLVNFRVTAGGGSVFAGSALTNAQGIAQERWTLGTSTQGEQRVEARAVSSSTGEALVFGTFAATARPGPAASIEVVAGNGQSALAGHSLGMALSVRVRDQYGNAVSGVAVAFAIASGGGSITNATSTTDASGVATAGTWTLGQTEGTQTLTATSGGAAAAIVSATARSRTPAQLTVVAGNNQSAVVGAAVTTAPAVLVQNALGDALPGVTVTFVPVAGSGFVTGGSVTTDTLGRAAVGSWTLGTTAGAQVLSVSAAMLSAQVAASATTGAIATLTVVGIPPATAEVASVSTFTVRAADQFGNPVSGAEVTFDVTGGGGSVAPTLVTTSADGRASASWTLGTAVGQNGARARVGAGVAVSVGATSTAGAPARLVAHAGDNQSATVGTAVAIRPGVVVEDRFGNPVPNATVTFEVASGGGTAGSTAVTGADGVATVSAWVLGTTATSNSLRASAPGTSAISFTATALAGAPVTLTKTAGDAQVAGVGTLVTVRPTATVRDGYGNPVPNVGVVFSVIAGDGAVTGGDATTDVSGIASVGSWRLGSAPGQQALTAVAQGTGSVTFTAMARDLVAARIVAHPSNVTSAVYGDTITASVIVLDEFGGPVQGVPVTFSTPFITGVITGANAVTNADGIASVGSWIQRICSGPSTLRATAAGVVEPLDMAVTVVSNGPDHLSTGEDMLFSRTRSIDGGPISKPWVKVLDGCSRDVAGVTVSFAVTPERSSFTVASAVTDFLGIARTNGWNAGGGIPGVTTLTATVLTLKGQVLTTSFVATLYHGQPARLVKLTGDAQTGPAGSTLPVALSLRVEDAYGYPAPNYITPFTVGLYGVPGAPVSIRFTGLDSGAGSVTLAVNPDGTVTAPPWTLGIIVGVQSVTVTNPAPPLGGPTLITTFGAQATVPPDQ